MLKITPYLGILVLIVSIGGLFYPKLGYFLLIVFATLMITSVFRGRWFCGNLCPRGSFNDFWITKISRKKKIKSIFSKLYIRVPIFIIMMGAMIYRILKTDLLVNQIGMIFVVMCLVTTLISICFGVLISPRTWCTFCPMGTLQRFFGGNKYKLTAKHKKCSNCRKCHDVCPMQLSVSEITHNPDCIKCGRCVDYCPTKALSFRKDFSFLKKIKDRHLKD